MDQPKNAELMNAGRVVLQEANFDAWESVSGALERLQVPTSRSGWLTEHLLETKRGYWQLIAQTLGIPPPPDLDLVALMHWEVEAAAALDERQEAASLEYAGRTFTVAGLIRLNARHSVWHAGQLSAELARSE